jgi:general secretion pathway protein A
MYTQFFKLNHAPFSIAPDPRYLFMSERHREALAHLLYGVNSGGGFVLLTGEIGAGKTTICRCFLEQIPANCHVAYIFNPKLTVNELLKSICDEFGIDNVGAGRASVKDYVDALNRYLLATHAAGQNNVLIIDEAQNLLADVLEQLRLLTNLETNEHKLLQIILIGQPELRALLAKPELQQLAQRVIARYHLNSLSQPETARYILHRLTIAGLTTESPIPASRMKQIHRLTQGVPRRINLLCDRALLGAYAENRQEVSRRTVTKAAREVFGSTKAPYRERAQVLNQDRIQPWEFATLGLLAGILLAGAAAWLIVSTWLIGSHPRTKTVHAEKNSVTMAIAPEKPALPIAAPASSTAIAAAALPLPGPTPDSKIDASVRDLSIAYRQLAELWNGVLPDGEPCQAARKIALYCYKSSNGLAALRQLDRPAILILRDDADKNFYTLLIGIDNTSVTLRVGNKTQTVSLPVLGRHFQGEFITLWRAPQNARPNVRDGERGADVDWLGAHLTRLNGLKEPVADQPFDATLAKLVREFQSAQGLKVDGVVGPKTYMLLNRALHVKEPQLQTSLTLADTSAGK